MTSAVLILPDAYRNAGNAFGVIQGWGEGNFSVPLSPTGVTPATHWGCRADVSGSFLEMMADPPAEAIPLLAVMVSSFEDSIPPFEHWVTTLTANGLIRAEDLEP